MQDQRREKVSTGTQTPNLRVSPSLPIPVPTPRVPSPVRMEPPPAPPPQIVVAASNVGRFEAFDPEKLSWDSYAERLDQFFIANDVVDDRKKRALLITSLSMEQYRLLTNFFAPDSPTTTDFETLCDRLRQHYVPEKVEIAEVFNFYQRKQQPNEDVKTFLADLRFRAKDCDFGAFLNRALRDAFVIGLRDSRVQAKLFTVKNLSLDNAVTIAQGMESANQQTQQMRRIEIPTSSSSVNYQSTSKSEERACYRCGNKNHLANKCTYSQTVCKKCNRVGHLGKMCRSKDKSKKGEWNKEKKKTTGVNFNTEESETVDLDSDTMYSVSNNNASTRRPPYVIPVGINNVKVNMHIDTGSPTSLIPETKWCLMGKPNLFPATCKLRSFTGNHLDILGEFRGKVEINGSTQVMTVTVTRGDNVALLGRDWLETRRIDWQSVVNSIDGPTLPSRLQPWSDLFHPNLGKIRSLKVKLLMKSNATPKFFRPRPVPYALHSRVKDELNRLESDGVIKRVDHSDWATPLVVVNKPDGSIRLCCDFKVTINSQLQIDQYPLPRPEDIFSDLQGSKFFSKIDLSRAYLQMELDEESQKYTTINTIQGLYKYTRLPFGVACAPAKFQKFMEDLLRDVPYCSCYLDDVLVHGGNTEDEHFSRVEKVLQKFRDSNIRLNFEKCLFCVTEVEHLGHVISKDGIKPSKKKISAVTNAPEPKSVNELRSFLGLVTYYGKFIPSLSAVAYPLNQLLNKDAKWKWGKSEKSAWDKLKQLLVSHKVLTHYSLNLPVRLACDASSYGLGAVLSHVLPDGSERPVAFASRSLSPSEKNYSQLDKEALSIIFGVVRFHQFIYGRKFTLITDHKPLLAILGPNSGIPTLAAARMQRWALVLSAYTYELEFRPTNEHSNADALSRCPLPSFPDRFDFEFCYSMELFSEAPLTVKEISAETKKDTVLNSVINRLQSGWRHSDSCSELATYFRKKLELSIQNGVLLWGRRVIVPNSLRPKILTLLHSEHSGISRMKSVARSYVWWPNIDDNLDQSAKNCEKCQQQRNEPPKVTAKWQSSQEPWQRIHIDFAGPIDGVNLLIIVDSYSKWPEVKIMNTITSSATIEHLRTIFSDRGVPRVIVSDNGTQFTSSVFQEFVKRNGIRHYMGAPFHPSTNGQVERMVQTVKKFLKKNQDQPGTLNTKLARFLLSYRNTPHPESGHSPAFLLTGRPLRSILDLLKPEAIPRRENLPPVRFSIGQNVLARDYTASKEKWIKGVIVKRLGAFLFLVQIHDNYQVKRHVDQMLPDSSSLSDPDVKEMCQIPTVARTPSHSVPDIPTPVLSPVVNPDILTVPVNNANVNPTIPVNVCPDPPQPIVQPADIPIVPPLRRSKRPTKLPQRLAKDFVLSLPS